jgi:hypothetical protein
MSLFFSLAMIDNEGLKNCNTGIKVGLTKMRLIMEDYENAIFIFSAHYR